MSEPVRIGIVLGSTRQGRFADKPAQWLLEIARLRTDARFELVDLRDYPLPLFDEPKSPLREPSQKRVAVEWRTKVGSLDGFIFVHGEYNHSIPASLKNALDYVYAEWNRKPAGFVSYGNAGGARGVEQLRLMLIELQMAPVRSAVHIGPPHVLDLYQGKMQLADIPTHATAAHTLLDDITWWATALRTARRG